MKVSELSFNESFSRTTVGVTEKFQPTGGGIDPGTFGTQNKRATFTPTRLLKDILTKEPFALPKEPIALLFNSWFLLAIINSLHHFYKYMKSYYTIFPLNIERLLTHSSYHSPVEIGGNLSTLGGGRFF